MASLLTSHNLKDNIAKLYVPTLIVSNKRELASLKSTYPPTLEPVVGSANAPVTLNTVFSSILESTILVSFGFTPIAIHPALDRLIDIIDIISGKKKIEEAQQALKELYAQVKENYDAYVYSHDEYVQDIIVDIDEINRIKSIFKEKVLLEVAKKLREMGINNTIGDYNVEELNEDILGLDTGLIDIMSDMSELEPKMKESDSLLDLFLDYLGFLLAPANTIFRNRKEARQLKEKIAEFEKEIHLENEKIKADIVRIGMFERALTNVMYIFKDIAKNLIPLIMDIIDDIEKKYHDNYNEIPSTVLMALHASCKILKGMAEKNIFGKRKRKQATPKDVIKYSNELSMEYNHIKEEILTMA